MISDSTTHRGTLFQLVKIAQAVLGADGRTPDLARLREDMPALRIAICDAAAFARRENHSQGRAAWPMLAQACNVTLHHIAADDGTAPVRETVTRWKTIVGALFPLVAADWQAWRDATAPKLGSSAPAPIVADGDGLDPRTHFERYAAPRGYDLTRYTAGEYRHPDTREAWGLFQFAAGIGRPSPMAGETQ
ncbi:hypothetical protein [Azorhizobium sp. AG788]|uniref:hypothetical protein n=1 Tax=Azorhizobium sp. AG788 TaxID=2183897 RepID=UPI0031399238